MSSGDTDQVYHCVPGVTCPVLVGIRKLPLWHISRNERSRHSLSNLPSLLLFQLSSLKANRHLWAWNDYCLSSFGGLSLWVPNSVWNIGCIIIIIPIFWNTYKFRVPCEYCIHTISLISSRQLCEVKSCVFSSWMETLAWSLNMWYWQRPNAQKMEV